MNNGDTVQRWEQIFGANGALKYTAGRHVFHEGATATYFYVVRDGLLKLSCNLSDGRHTILGLRYAGEFAGKISFVDHASQSFTATAVVDSTVIRVPLQEIRATIRRRAEAAELLLSMFERQLETTSEELVDQKTLTTPEIIERLLGRVDSCNNLTTPGVLLVGHSTLPDQEIAELVGVSPEHFSRIKRRLIKEGKLTANRAVFEMSSLSRR
jgi:CRP-like cAMP-binding protein